MWKTGLPQNIWWSKYMMIHIYIYIIIEGSLEVKLPTIWTDEKQRWEESEKRRQEEKRSKRESLRRKKIQVREKVGKSRNIAFFPMICGSGGSKSRLAKAAGAEPAGQMRDEKLHAVVARSTFRSQNVQNTTCSRHFWRFRCRKSGRCCGRKHISKSKCANNHMLGPRLEVAMSKKCTLLWRQNVQSTPGPDHFWKLRCRKSAWLCGAKHISKSKC